MWGTVESSKLKTSPAKLPADQDVRPYVGFLYGREGQVRSLTFEARESSNTYAIYSTTARFTASTLP